MIDLSTGIGEIAALVLALNFLVNCPKGRFRRMKMEPTIMAKNQLLVAGISAAGNETAKAWQTFMQINKTIPLQNKANEDGYEIRFYSEKSGAVVHAGACVKNSKVPPQYRVVSLPASLYAEFMILPANGYTSSNTAMQKWLNNHQEYQQRKSGDKAFSILVYDNRYKGETDPISQVACWVPVVKK
jgi:predicted transcriptional regulator YdeE